MFAMITATPMSVNTITLRQDNTTGRTSCTVVEAGVAAESTVEVDDKLAVSVLSVESVSGGSVIVSV